MTNPNYGKVTEELLIRLREIVGDKNVLTGDERENYSRDETPRLAPSLPEAVVKPESAAAIAEIMKLAGKYRIPVTPRGAGTGICGGAVPSYGGIVLSLERMNRVLEIDKENFITTVEPGVILSDLYRAVETEGLYFPLYPEIGRASCRERV